jgi:hypothetical protein
VYTAGIVQPKKVHKPTIKEAELRRLSHPELCMNRNVFLTGGVRMRYSLYSKLRVRATTQIKRFRLRLFFLRTETFGKIASIV